MLLKYLVPLLALMPVGAVAAGNPPPVDGFVAPNDPALSYSPYNWTPPGKTSAVTINAGAYFRLAYAGAACAMHFDVSSDKIPVPQLWVIVDGQPRRLSPVQPNVSCAPNASTRSASWHVLEVVVKATTETQLRWSASPATQVNFTGLSLAPGAAYRAAGISRRRIEIVGDSITEGVRTLGDTEPSDTDRNDAMAGWAWAVGAQSTAEFGIVGFGGTGLVATGSGGVAPLPQSWNIVLPGVRRSFATCPDTVLINEGTNDSGAPSDVFRAAYVSVLRALFARCPATRIVAMRPFNGAHWNDIQAAVATLGSGTIGVMDTSGFFDPALGADDLGIHPTAANNIGFIAPRVISALDAQDTPRSLRLSGSDQKRATAQPNPTANTR